MSDPTRRRIREDDRGERGETLMETIISLLLIATVVMAVVFGLLTLMLTTRQNRELVGSGNESMTVAEQLKRTGYQPCGGGAAPLSSYRSTVDFAVPGYEAEVMDVRFLKQKDSTTPPGGESFQSGCPAVDQGVQEIRVKLTPREEDGHSQELLFYKRRDACPAQSETFEGKQC